MSSFSLSRPDPKVPVLHVGECTKNGPRVHQRWHLSQIKIQFHPQGKVCRRITSPFQSFSFFPLTTSISRTAWPTLYPSWIYSVTPYLSAWVVSTLCKFDSKFHWVDPVTGGSPFGTMAATAPEELRSLQFLWTCTGFPQLQQLGPFLLDCLPSTIVPPGLLSDSLPLSTTWELFKPVRALALYQNRHSLFYQACHVRQLSIWPWLW